MGKIDYLKYCILYKGEKKLEDNPLKKSDDEFKWYMWRHEWNALRLAKEQVFANENELEDFIKEEILASIEMFADAPYGGASTKWIEKYFSY